MRRIYDKKLKPVHILVHPDFYNKMELERKKLERKRRTNLTNFEFTKTLAMSRIELPTLGEVFNGNKKPQRRRY